MRAIFPQIAVLVIASISSALPAYAEPGSGYPVQAVLKQFSETCADTSSAANLAAAIQRAGWRAVPSSANVALDKLVSEGAAAANKLRDHVETYQIEVAGRQLYLIAESGSTSGITDVSCAMHDFDADTDVYEKAVVDWMRRPPDQKLDQQGMTFSLWRPGLSGAASFLRLLFVVPGSPGDIQMHLGGLTLRANSTARQ